MRHHLETLADAQAVARIAAAFVAEQARRAVDSGGRFHFAVSGGHTPRGPCSRSWPWGWAPMVTPLPGAWRSRPLGRRPAGRP
jgi:hypothetical protein